MYTFGLAALPSSINLAQNLALITTYVKKAKELGCTAVCFPECALTGYAPALAAEYSISSDSAPVDTLSNLAHQLQIDILVGMMERTDLHFYITQIVLLADGSKQHYRKTHLGERERLVFAAGDDLPVFPLSCGLKIGFQLCVETHYNDITQTLSLRGADIIFAPHAVPRISKSRKNLWETYIPARSYDNQVYMACCNQWDPDKFAGGILVTAPDGTILTSSYDQETLSTFSIEGVSEHNRFYFPSKRRTELYD